MELNQLLQFKMIAECKTMREAAEKLHISQPALSFSLKKLEEELGVQLFSRFKNRIILNNAGKLALRHADVVLDQAEEMKKAFQQYMQTINGCLALGFCDAGPMRLCVPLLQKACPNLSLSAEIIDDENKALYDLLSEKYDAVISLEKLKNSDVVSIPFAKEMLMLSVAKNDPLCQKTSICLHDYVDREISAYRIYGAFERKINDFLNWIETLASVTVYTDYFVFRQMLEHKKVLTFTTRLVQLYRNDGERVIIPLEEEGITALYWLSYNKKEQKKLEPFLEWHQNNRQMLLGLENEKK